MEDLKNAVDFSDFPRTDLIVAGAVLIFLFIFPLFPHSSYFHYFRTLLLPCPP